MDPRYFRFDSPARVCFLSVFPSAWDLSFPRPRHTRAGGGPKPKAALESVSCWRRRAGYRMHGLFSWSSKWWPGLIPLVAFWAIAAWTSTAPLEADLAARSSAALKDTVLDKTRIA